VVFQPGTRRLLVVDDDPLVLEVVRTMLTAVGHEVIATHDPQKAVELIWNEHFDVVLTDLGMPVVSGWTVARQAKAKNGMTPVILITGWGTQYEEMDLSRHGIDLVLSKPLDRASLVGAVDELLTPSIPGYGEHRQHRRFRGRKGESVRLVDASLDTRSNPARIIDVSMGGLSFLHSGNENRTGALLSVDILCQEGLELRLLQCQVVYDVTFQIKPAFSPIIGTRRCGVQFKGLSLSQLSQLEDLIRRHAMDDD
jgi:CheY-like chemotaxis protein